MKLFNLLKTGGGLPGNSRSFFLGLLISYLTLTLFMPSSPLLARPRYAKQTGLACKACHINPHGGGTLTKTGAQFRDAGYILKDGPKKGQGLSLYILALIIAIILIVLFILFLKKRSPHSEPAKHRSPHA